MASPCPVPDGVAAMLPGADFSDCYFLEQGEPRIDALTAARRALSTMPWWVKALMALRNSAVAPFALIALGPSALGRIREDWRPAERIGLFPLLAQDAERVVLGMDAWHLDFRIVVDASAESRVASDRCIRVTTLVRTHNWPGRTYLRIVLPFHRVIVPALLDQAARQSGASVN